MRRRPTPLVAALDQPRRDPPDLVVVDVRMPPTHTDEGLRAARATCARVHPGVAVLVLSQYVEERLRRPSCSPATSAGVGYLLKDRVADVDELRSTALRRVAAGGTVLDPEVVAQLLAPRRAATRSSRLTPREREVLALMAEGRSNAAIAERARRRPRAPSRSTSRRIFAKLDLPPDADDHRRVLAVLRWLEHGTAQDPSNGAPR